MNPKQVGTRLSQIVPGQEALTLVVITNVAGADVPTNVSVPKSRRRPVDRKDLLLVGANVGETWVGFQIYDTGLSAVPIVGYKLVDANSVTYEIRMVHGRTVQNVYNVVALQNK